MPLSTEIAPPAPSAPRRALRAAARVAVGVLLAAVPGGALAQAPAPPPVASGAARWTAATPDEMVDHLFARARRGGDDALAALVVAASIEDRASFGKVRDGLAALAASASPLADDARWLRLRLLPSPAGRPWPGLRAVAYDAPPDADGLVKSLAILGPFQDTGGGLMRREGPEAPGQSWADPAGRYAWGVYDVAWRRVLPASATARGVPLDLYVHPRNESCTYLGSKVTVPAGTRPMLVHLASTGAVRLLWDGADVAASDEVRAHLLLDRLTARIEAAPGDHLLAVKVCSAAVGDEGRVRLRFTDEQRRPLALATSSDLRSLAASLGVSRAAPAAPPEPSAEERAEAARHEEVRRGLAADAARKTGGDDPYADGPAAKAAPQKAEGPAAKAAPKKAAAAPARGAKKGPPARAGKAEPEASVAAITPPRGVTVLPRSIDALLETGDAPAVDRALLAAILRIVGGVDDARSPRAPGLLDRVARAPETTPDQLAMAGWISPFGANRSGWLNLARTRADAAGDAATSAFAQRRLVAAHLTARYIDWAISTAGEEPIKSAPDPEAALIRALVKKQVGGSGFGRAALEDLQAIDAPQPGKTPVSVLTEMFGLARTQGDTYLRLAQRLGKAQPDARGAAYVAAFRFEGVEAVERAAATTLAEQTSIEDVLRIGRQLLDAGRWSWAREVYYTATQLAPNRSAGFIGLAAAREGLFAAEQRDGKPPSEDPSLARSSLTRARDLEPSDAALKAEIGFRSNAGDQPDSAPSRAAVRDETHLVKPEVFLARAHQHPVTKGEIVDRQLHWMRVVTYHPDKRVSQLMHYAREVVIEPRTEQDLFENLPAEGDETEVILARVHKKDGTVVQPDELSSGGKKPFVRWPELKTGDVVEIAARSWTAGPVGRRGDAPFWFIDYVGSTDTHPILYNEVVIDSPESGPLAIDVLRGKPDRVERTAKDGRVVTRYAWDKPPTIPDEPLAPKLSETLPVVVGSTFASWADFREWYRAAVQGFTEPDDQVRRLAADLTKGKKTRDEKLQAIFEFVADDIRYVNYVSGEWWLPNRPQELLARRQGDCDDKAMLLITLLKAVGIEANEVLVQTRYTAQPSLLRSEKAAIPLFDHGIAYLPGEKGKPGIWLDATSPESRLGPLPSMDARTVAFFIDEGPAKIVDTPASSPDEHGIDAGWTITLSPSGAGDLVADERHSGDAAFELRMNLKQPDARAQWVEQYLASGWFPTVQVTGDIAFKPDLPRGVANLKYGAHSEGFARREGGELAVPLAESSTITSQLAPLVKRVLPVVLPARLAPGHETRTITIVAPPGYTFAELPPSGDVNGGEFGKAHLEFARASGKNAVIVKRSVVFDLATIPVEKYARWRAFLQQVDGLMHRTVRLFPDDKASARPAVRLVAGTKPKKK
jgi:transglutaminase-like putative cysteine protease